MKKLDFYHPETRKTLQPGAPDLFATARDDAGNPIIRYLPSPGLGEAVNIAIALGQPLLLTGDPGTGKTQLAWHVAQQCDLGAPIVFNAQTGSAQKDLFYHYDALGHFQWAHNQQGGTLPAEEFEDKFIRYEGLGEAIRRAKLDGRRSVVLIDEVDKAPRDLPNDLLAAIEELRFDVPEVPIKPKRHWECPPELRPVVIVTSNSEKNLPDAFLRRVVYFHIETPRGKALVRILQAKTPAFKGLDLDAVVEHFELVQEKTQLKKPATAELIAWASLLEKTGFPTEKLYKNETDKLTEPEKALLDVSYGVLVKTRDDRKNVQGEGKG